MIKHILLSELKKEHPLKSNVDLRFAETFAKLSDIVNFDSRCHPNYITLDRILEEDPNNSFLIEEVYESMDCKIAEMEIEIADMKALRKDAEDLARLIQIS